MNYEEKLVARIPAQPGTLAFLPAKPEPEFMKTFDIYNVIFWRVYQVGDDTADTYHVPEAYCVGYWYQYSADQMAQRENPEDAFLALASRPQANGTTTEFFPVFRIEGNEPLSNAANLSALTVVPCDPTKSLLGNLPELELYMLAYR